MLNERLILFLLFIMLQQILILKGNVNWVHHLSLLCFLERHWAIKLLKRANERCELSHRDLLKVDSIDLGHSIVLSLLVR